MKKIFLTILFIKFSLDLFCQVAGSNVIMNGEQLAVKIYKIEDENEYRFYDDRGFYCYSIMQDSEDDFLNYGYEGERSLKLYNDVDYTKDEVFSSDHFAMDFVEKIKSCNCRTFEDRFKQTVSLYYRPSGNKCEYGDNFIESIVSSGKVINVDESLSGFRIVYPVIMIKDWYPKFQKTITEKLRFSKKERNVLDSQLVFEIVFVSKSGELKDIRLVSPVTEKKKVKIEENILNVDNKIIRPIYPKKEYMKPRIFKASIYVNI